MTQSKDAEEWNKTATKVFSEFTSETLQTLTLDRLWLWSSYSVRLSQSRQRLQFSSKRGCKIYTNPSLWLHVLCFGSGRLQRQCQWQSSKLSDRAPVFLEWLIWNTGQYKHSPAHHRQYHWKAKLLHRSQDFIGCHVDFACSGISIGLSMILWLMVCVFWLWNQQPESPEPAAHQDLKSTTPPGSCLWVLLLMQPQHISLSLLYIQPCLALLSFCTQDDLHCNLLRSGQLGHPHLCSPASTDG